MIVGEEITTSYGMGSAAEIDEGQVCACGSPACSGLVGGLKVARYITCEEASKVDDEDAILEEDILPPNGLVVIEALEKAAEVGTEDNHNNHVKKKENWRE